MRQIALSADPIDMVHVERTDSRLSVGAHEQPESIVRLSRRRDGAAAVGDRHLCVVARRFDRVHVHRAARRRAGESRRRE